MRRLPFAAGSGPFAGGKRRRTKAEIDIGVQRRNPGACAAFLLCLFYLEQAGLNGCFIFLYVPGAIRTEKRKTGLWPVQPVGKAPF